MKLCWYTVIGFIVGTLVSLMLFENAAVAIIFGISFAIMSSAMFSRPSRSDAAPDAEE